MYILRATYFITLPYIKRPPLLDYKSVYLGFQFSASIGSIETNGHVPQKGTEIR